MAGAGHDGDAARELCRQRALLARQARQTVARNDDIRFGEPVGSCRPSRAVGGDNVVLQCLGPFEVNRSDRDGGRRIAGRGDAAKPHLSGGDIPAVVARRRDDRDSSARGAFTACTSGSSAAGSQIGWPSERLMMSILSLYLFVMQKSIAAITLLV